MFEAKKLLIGFVLILIIGTGTAFADWSSSATGSCTCGDTITFYPWSNWTKPEYGGDPPFNYDEISGSWNDGTYSGHYWGVKDSTTGGPLEDQYRWYSGCWSVKLDPYAEAIGGNFWLRVQLNVIPVPWNGEWWDLEPPLCPCTGGTMTGYNSEGPEQ